MAVAVAAVGAVVAVVAVVVGRGAGRAGEVSVSECECWEERQDLPRCWEEKTMRNPCKK